MRNLILSILYVLVGSGVAICAHATTADAVGTVGYLQQDTTNDGSSTETFQFTLSPQPTVSCGPFNRFLVSPQSIPDAQTRKNLLALLLTAKTAGLTLQVRYDPDGGHCDQGMIAVFYIVML